MFLAQAFWFETKNLSFLRSFCINCEYSHNQKVKTMKSWFNKRKSVLTQIENSSRRNSSADSPDSIIRNEVLDKIQRFINTDDDDKRFTYIEDIIQIQKQSLDLNSLYKIIYHNSNRYSSFIGNGTFNSFLNSLGSYLDEWLEFIKDKYKKPKHIDKSDHYCIVEMLNIICSADNFFSISLCTTELLTAVNDLLAVLTSDIPDRV